MYRRIGGGIFGLNGEERGEKREGLLLRRRLEVERGLGAK
jgi:hypothetical protein